MDPMALLSLITGSGGALIVLSIGIYALATGKLARGSEVTDWRLKYEALNDKYMKRLEERAANAEALASTTVQVQRAVQRANADQSEGSP